MGSVSAEEIDNWPENDAWLHIELISWTANQTVEWDNNDGLPDPQFRICIEADGDNVDCINSPTWDNQWSLNNSWNYSLDIPDHSDILNITIECEDNDAFNDDECDMNSELNEWKLYAEYNWSATPTLTVTGNGDGDGNETWKNAASTWKFSIDGFGDEDGDGVSDNLDNCPATLPEEELGANLLDGCSWYQLDVDFDGVISRYDSEPFNIGIGQVVGGNRELIRQDINHQACSRSGNEQLSRTLGYGEDRITINGTTNYYQQPNSTITMDCNSNIFWNRPLFDINFDGIVEHYSEEGLRTFEQGMNGGSSFDSFDVCGGGGGINWASPGLNTKQVVGESTILVHCQTASTSNICSTIYSIKLVNDSNISVNAEYYLENCKNVGSDAWHPSQNGGGVFGDFDGNGKLDLVVNTDTGCDIYYGLNTENFSFFGPQEIISSSMCGTEMMVVADIDNDGFDDLVTYSYVHFFSDGSIESVELLLDTDGGNHNPGIDVRREVIVMDFEGDGDLDILRSKSDPTSQNGFMVSTNLIVNSWIPDIDSDGIADYIDLCNSTPTGSTVDWQGCANFEKDTDDDGVTDDIDLCSSTLAEWNPNTEGCSEEQLDDDYDGLPNAFDECENTPPGTIVNAKGCSTEESTDADGDGVVNSEDDCPDTPPGYPVLENGCSDEESLEEDLDGDGYSGPYSKILFVQSGDAFPLDSTQWFDEDGDGYGDNPSPANNYDACPNTKSGASVNAFGCSDEQLDSDYDGVSNAEDAFPYDQYEQYDADNDGIGDNSDQCSDSIVSNVDSTGCSQSQLDSASAGSDGDAMLGFMTCCVLPIGMVVYFSRQKKKKATKSIQYVPMNIPASRPVQRQPTQQEMHAQNMLLEKQRETNHLQLQLANQASQTQHLQQQLAQQNQTAAQMNSMQAELAALQQSKATLEKELEEAAKATTVVQNITYNIQDSAIAGDLNANLNPKSDEN